MNIADNCHLSYCTNIHPGEDWPSLFSSLKVCLPAVKKNVCPEVPFGVGLRLSALAVDQLLEKPTLLAELKSWLSDEDLYVFTLNGFPYGTFHGEVIKEKVYQPDWTSQQRFRYSCQLARVLAELLPKNQHGSISTVPIGFKSDFSRQEKVEQAIDQLLAFTDFLVELKKQRGRHIQLALEPEPGCVLETTEDSLQIFSRIFARNHIDKETLTSHLGLCLDTCHTAVMFESPLEAANTFLKAGIAIHKIQLTAALMVKHASTSSIKALEQFIDSSYLHQSTVLQQSTIAAIGSRAFYMDLPQALQSANAGDEIRSHFHVPVFRQNMGELQTTQAELQELLCQHKVSPLSPHMEVETYTFDVLPMALRSKSVVDNISRELNWVLEQLR